MPLEAGRLDRRITIQSYTTSADSYGEPLKTWADFVTVWAQYLPLRGAERFAAKQVDATIEAKFRLRWRDDLDTTMRITFESRTWDIAGIVEIGRREGLEIIAAAHVP